MYEGELDTHRQHQIYFSTKVSHYICQKKVLPCFHCLPHAFTLSGQQSMFFRLHIHHIPLLDCPNVTELNSQDSDDKNSHCGEFVALRKNVLYSPFYSCSCNNWVWEMLFVPLLHHTTAAKPFTSSRFPNFPLL